MVDVRDVAAGCIAATEQGRIGECYLLSDEYREIREVLGLTAVLCGKKQPPVLPMPLARLAEPLLRFWAKKNRLRPLYTRYSLDTLESKTRFSAQKAKNELGYTARDVRIAVRDTVQWLTGYRR